MPTFLKYFVLGVILFYTFFTIDAMPRVGSITLHICIFIFLVLFGINITKFGIFRFLNAYYILLLSIPFFILIDFLFYQRLLDRERSMTSPLLSNLSVTYFITNLILLGLNGFLLGLMVGKAIFKYKNNFNWIFSPGKSLSLMNYYILLGATVLIYQIISPSGNIFSAYYMDIRETSNRAGIPGLEYLLQSLLLILFIDFKVSNNHERSKKKKIWLISFLYILVFLQLFKGERPIAGLCFAIFLINIFCNTIKKSGSSNSVIKLHKISIKFKALLLLFIVVFYSLSFFRDENRHGIVNRGIIKEIGFEAYKKGTWMGGFYSSLGLAEEYVNGHFKYYNGQTYIDYILSLPPSFISNLLGYERPISSTSGPGFWYMGYTSGGLSPLIVPFKNFGYVGVFVILLLWGLTVVGLETFLLQRGLKGLFFYASFIMATPHLFWYGEMYVIRSIMSAIVVYFFYTKLLK